MWDKLKPGLIVDHKNRKRNDYRKSNLRVCTPLENVRNSGLSIKNTHGEKGIYYDKRKVGKKWIARAREGYKYKQLGSFSTKEEAIQRRLEHERNNWGEFMATRDEDYRAK